MFPTSPRILELNHVVGADPPTKITLCTHFLQTDSKPEGYTIGIIFGWWVAFLRRVFRTVEGRLEQDTQYAHPFAAGVSADIYRGKLIMRNKQQFLVAIKIVKYPAEKATLHFRREASVWSELRHEHLVPLLGFVDRKNILISPFYDNGNLGIYLKNNPEADLSPIVLGITAGLEHLHTKGIVHGDLKPANILVDKDGVACISDFGISKVVDSRGFTTYSVGTVTYMAPELFIVVSRGIDPQPIQGSRTTKSSDIYSFGLLVLEVLTSESPKRRPGGMFITEETFQNLRVDRMDYHGKVKDVLWEVLNPCLSFEPRARPHMVNLLASLTAVLGANSVAEGFKTDSFGQ